MNYLIYGSSYKLIDIEIKKLIKDKSYKTYDISEYAIKDILEDLGYSSMFDEEKIIILKNIDVITDSKKENKENISLLINYLKSPNESTTLILTSSTMLKEKNEILNYVKIINTPIISKPQEFANTLGNIIKTSGYAISTNALNIFSTKCNQNLDIALMEFEKLKISKKENHLISEDDIENIVSNYNTNDIFEIKDAIISKDITKSQRLIDEMENSKMEIIPIVVMLAKEYEMIYNISVLKEKKLNNDEIGQKLGGIHPYRVKLLRDISNKYKLDDLKKIILYLCDLDLKLVSSDNLGYDELRKFLLYI